MKSDGNFDKNQIRFRSAITSNELGSKKKGGGELTYLLLL